MKNRYAFLDGIRGIAAIFVLTLHTPNFWTFKIGHAYLAVDLFFILSGFVIAYAYDERVRDNIITLKSFLIIRLIRLYPIFFLSVLLSCVVLIAKAMLGDQGNMQELPEIMVNSLYSAFFLPSVMNGSPYLFPINVPYWSLFFELVVNFLYASMRSVLSDFVLGMIVSVAGLLIMLIAYFNENLNVGFLWGFGSIAAGFCRSVFGIFMGLLMYRHYAFLTQKIGKIISPWFAFILITLVLLFPNVEPFNAVVDVVSVVFLFPIFVFFASAGSAGKLEKILLILGSASYPIYVLHKPFGELVYSLMQKLSVNLAAPFSGIVFVVFLVILSLGLEKFYDIPLRRMMLKCAFGKGSN